MKRSVCLALVHNKNPLRNSYVIPNINMLFGGVGSHAYTYSEMIDISYQGVANNHGSLMAIFREIVYINLSREWCRYRLIKPPGFFRDAVSFLRKLLFKYIANYQGARELWKKNSAIEVIVTEKHIRAWGRFLDAGADYLICFEDDAVFKNDSCEKIAKLLDSLSGINMDVPVYVDLAGGCGLDELKIYNLESGKDATFRLYKKPVTNTACVYLMSRPLVALFHALLLKKPWLRLIGIDWMMNNLFIIIDKNEIECFCMHADPPIFKHGTTTGEYVSWQVK